MIGLVCEDSERAIFEEFFQLFKTPWEFAREGSAYPVLLATVDPPDGVRGHLIAQYGSQRRACDDEAPGSLYRKPGSATVIRIGDVELPLYGEIGTFPEGPECQRAAVIHPDTCAGYVSEGKSCLLWRLGFDLAEEIRCLLERGQPQALAHFPTLDLHIEALRQTILRHNLPLVELLGAPYGSRAIACLTHDIDFVGIRQHRFDLTMWGFVYRSLVGTVRQWLRGRFEARNVFRSWAAVARLPFVYLGWARDFWLPFEWYLEKEAGLSSTYFFIPFKGCAGQEIDGRAARLRASKYDLSDVAEWIARLAKAGHEIGVHGIDGWHSTEAASRERERVSAVAPGTVSGVRMHWLLQDERTVKSLDAAGFEYDSTSGYNDTVGYRNGTLRVFKPIEAEMLLELPLHIQDGALFFPNRLGLSETEAWSACARMINDAKRLGGVLTVLWHDRSHGPERFWGDFYCRLLDCLRSGDFWIANAGDAVRWFRLRRHVTFSCNVREGDAAVVLDGVGHPVEPPLAVRVYRPSGKTTRAPTWSDVSWNGMSALRIGIAGDLP